MNGGIAGWYDGYDHITYNAPDPIRTPKLTCVEPAQYWGGGPPGNSVVLYPFCFAANILCLLVLLRVPSYTIP